MKSKLLVGAVAIGLAAAPLVAYGAGLWSTLPVIGGNSFCGSNVSGVTLPAGQGPYAQVPGSTQGTGSGICGQTIPAGPTGPSGIELVPVDLNQNGGFPTQTAVMPSSLIGGLSEKVNRLIGGDMTTNPAQRLSTTKGIASLAAISPTAAVISADRWWVIAPAAGVTVTIDSTASTAVIPGFNNNKALRVARTTSGAAGIICTGQTLDRAQSQQLLGNNAVFSFYEENGAGQSASGGNITVNIDYTSQADGVATQATLGYAGVNGSIFALGDTAGSTTGLANYTNAVTGFSPSTTGTITSGVATIAGSTTWTRYSVYSSIPINIPNTTTPVSEISVSICFTPTATTAITTDYIEIDGMQLQGLPSTAGINTPNGVISPTGFEKRPAALEAVYAYYYWWFNYENQSLINVVGTCENTATTVANCLIPFPEPMRIAPLVKYTAGFQAFAQVAETSVSACSALANAASYAVVPATNAAFVACTAAVGAAGTANELTTLGTSSATGIISASAEP